MFYLYLSKFIGWVARLFQKSLEKDKEIDVTPEPIIEQVMETNQEKFLKVCLDALDTDPSTPDNIKDELGCTDTLSALIKRVFPDFPTILSTKDLDMKLFMDKRFRRELEPGLGRIIISPRTPNQTGHCGVWITNERIASNDSKTG